MNDLLSIVPSVIRTCTLNGPMSGNDEALAVAVASGTVYVGGFYCVDATRSWG